MELREHEAKALLARSDLPVPRSALATSPDGAVSAARRFGYPVMLKSQIVGGGRGKAGGVVRVEDDAEARAEAVRLLGATIRGLRCDELLVEERIAAEHEVYLSYALDRDSEQLWLLFSPSGGAEIETRPAGEMLRLPVAVRSGPNLEALRPFAAALGGPEVATSVARLAGRLYECVRQSDLLLAEINPLLVLGDGSLMLADARVEVDDNALFRHEELLAQRALRRDGTASELRAEALGVNGFVELGGEIGMVVNGAGLGMATMDLLEAKGLRPANFLETGGRITADLVRGALELVLDQPGIRGVMVNLYGGINPMVDAARGVAAALEARAIAVPVVVRLRGNEQEEAWSLLERAGVPTVRAVETEAAVETLARMVGVSA